MSVLASNAWSLWSVFTYVCVVFCRAIRLWLEPRQGRVIGEKQWLQPARHRVLNEGLALKRFESNVNNTLCELIILCADQSQLSSMKWAIRGFTCDATGQSSVDRQRYIGCHLSYFANKGALTSFRRCGVFLAKRRSFLVTTGISRRNFPHSSQVICSMCLIYYRPHVTAIVEHIMTTLDQQTQSEVL